MKIWPAIDLMDGRVVRLLEGKREAATYYPGAPEGVARTFFATGARRLHVVDLDAAFDPNMPSDAPNRRAIAAVLKEAAKYGAAVQIGGGVRSLSAIDTLMQQGASRVVLGTIAIKEPAILVAAAARYPGKIVVAVDAKDGLVATHGWTENSGRTALSVATEAASVGAIAVLYTDIALDGTGRGPNVDATARLQDALSISVIASGGVGSLAHLHALAEANIREVIVGKALHDARISLADALAIETAS